MAAPTSSKHDNTAPAAASAAADPSAPTPSAGTDLPKQYRPAEHEARIWDRWSAAKAFHADPARVLSGEARPYCILIPPPNVTARLHLGHALNNSLQDILTRAHRMMGFETLWMPGTDHAGIATQAVVERRVMQEEGKRRTDFQRDEFIAKIQAFKDDYEAQIIDQLQKIGCSCDWERVRFTMDEQCARAVREAFFRLFKDGLIYRGKRLVNWDPVLQTAVADDECYEAEIDGSFYYLRYPLVRKNAAGSHAPVTWNELATAGYPGADQHPGEEPAWVTVATTRPETYLGDVAVAINPHDPRAKSLRGLFAELPLVGRVIPIIEDSYVVLPEAYARTDEERADPKAGMATGYLKVTPAHDPNDYEIGRRHAQTIEAAGHPVLVNIFAPDATVSEKHGWEDVGDASLFIGMSREDARKKVVAEFKALGLLEGTKPHKHSVKHSDRSKAVIEPYLSDQWYVRVTDERMAGQANRALVSDQRTSAGSGSQSAPTDNRLQFHPARYAKTYEQWHDGIRDWCISRQLWWGHRIPVWTKTITIDATNRQQLVNGGDLDFLDASGASLFAWSWCPGETETEESANRLVGVAVFRHVASGRTFIGDATPGGPPWYGLPELDGEYEVAVCVNNAPSLVEYLEEESGFTQDPDVLDTWFSSALWPLSTLGWPESTPLLRAFNPTSTLCTAREIITLWVSRMVMFNRYFLPANFEQTGDAANASTSTTDAGPPPFRDVFVHAVIQDGEGRKMSKSLGNGVDPLDIVESHGADALRYTLCNMTTQTQDVRMPVERDPATGKNTSPKFDMGRNFGNKLWNAARFALAILGSASNPGSAVTRETNLSLADRWMLSRLAGGVQQAEAALREYNFANYAQTLYDLLWRDFCDWYLEAVKPTARTDAAQQAVLAHALETILRLIHPVMPYVTEAIFERVRAIETAPIDGITLGRPTKDGLLTTAGWPKVAAAWHNPEAEAAFDRARALITAIREVRAQHNVPPKRMVTYHPAAGLSVTDAEAALIRTLANVDTISNSAPAGPSVTFTYNAAEHRLSNLADAVDASAERARLEKLIADRNKQIKTLEGRLANPGYAQKAPPAMVEETRTQLQQAIQERDAANEQLAGLGA